MAIGRFGSGDESPEERVRREAIEDMPIGAPCKSDFIDELDAALAYAKEKEWSIHRMTAQEILECYRDRKQTPP